MKKVLIITFMVCAATVLMGCAGQTTDPRQGGLFSYNPDAYQERLQKRQETLSAIAAASEAAKREAVSLEDQKNSRAREKAALEQLLGDLTNAMVSLEKTVRSKQVETITLQNEQKRIIAEIETIKSAAQVSDNIEDPEEKRLEIERLRQRREELENEAAQLMLL